MPTPAATPFTAATIGLGSARMVRITGLKNLSSAEPESAVRSSRSGSERSAPAQKPRPAPVSRTARTEPSAPISSHACLISAIILRDTAFSLSGAFRVSVARPSVLGEGDRVVGHRLICPVNCAGRLARNAATPSLQSALWPSALLAVALEIELLVERVGGRER